jgi:ABC-type dipeptide/oligopeptide/nickel transport system permease component
MNIVVQLIKTILINLFVFLLIILIVLFPRHLDITIVNGVFYQEYNFHMDQYLENIKNFFYGLVKNKSLGDTRYFDTTVEEELARYMPRSLMVIFTALIISFFLGVMKGIYDYKTSKKRTSLLGNWTTWIFQSIPDFLLVLLIQWLIIRYFPFIKFFGREGWNAFILPSILVSIYPLMYIARITSASIAAQEGQQYIQVAKAKGLSNRMVLYKHILKNSMSTILSHLSSLMLYILSNLFIVEYFMNYQGAAQRFFMAIDYSKSFGTGVNYEPGIIIGISGCFMALILLVQIISLLVNRYFQPR